MAVGQRVEARQALRGRHPACAAILYPEISNIFNRQKLDEKRLEWAQLRYPAAPAGNLYNKLWRIITGSTTWALVSGLMNTSSFGLRRFLQFPVLFFLISVVVFATTTPMPPRRHHRAAHHAAAAPAAAVHHSAATSSTTSSKVLVHRAAYRVPAAPPVVVRGGPWTEPTYADSTMGDNADGEDLGCAPCRRRCARFVQRIGSGGGSEHAAASSASSTRSWRSAADFNPAPPSRFRSRWRL